MKDRDDEAELSGIESPCRQKVQTSNIKAKPAVCAWNEDVDAYSKFSNDQEMLHM